MNTNEKKELERTYRLPQHSKKGHPELVVFMNEEIQRHVQRHLRARQSLK